MKLLTDICIVLCSAYMHCILCCTSVFDETLILCKMIIKSIQCIKFTTEDDIYIDMITCIPMSSHIYQKRGLDCLQNNVLFVNAVSSGMPMVKINYQSLPIVVLYSECTKRQYIHQLQKEIIVIQRLKGNKGIQLLEIMSSGLMCFDIGIVKLTNNINHSNDVTQSKSKYYQCIRLTLHFYCLLMHSTWYSDNYLFQ